MSVVGKSVSDTTPVEIYQPVGLVAGSGSLGTEDNPVFTAASAAGGGASLQDVVDAINAHTVFLTQMATDTNELVQDTSVMVSLLNDIKTNTTPAG